MKLVVDTSFFTNPDSYKHWGQSISETILTFVDFINQRPDYQVFIPPTVLDEIASFFDHQTTDILQALEASITVKSPFIDNLQIPAAMFYDLVLEIKNRSYKGLRVAENLIRNLINNQTLNNEAVIINRLRKEYRQALRAGFLDSQADLDVLFLAYQLDAALVTMDEGLLKWAHRFGVATLQSAVLKRQLSS